MYAFLLYYLVYGNTDGQKVKSLWVLLLFIRKQSQSFWQNTKETRGSDM